MPLEQERLPELLRELAGLLAGEPLHILIEAGSSRMELTVEARPQAPRREEPPGPPSAGPNPAWRWLSPEEEEILAGVTNDYRPAKVLAKVAGMTASGAIYILLRNLVNRGILESSADGYRV